MDTFQKKIIYSYKLFTVFRIFLITQTTVFRNKPLGRHFLPCSLFSVKS